MNESKKTGWGGVRPGAGRPKSATGVTMAVYVPKEIAAETRQKAAARDESLSEYVTGALVERNRKEEREGDGSIRQ